MEIRRWSRARLWITGAVTLLCMAAALLHTQEAEQGITDGIRICAQTLIPSLFPFLFLSTFLVRSGACAAMGRPLSPMMRALFGLPGNCAGAVLMSLLGGYPVGVGMAAELRERGEITAEQARRMALFCVNAGPAFTISAVGAGMTGSTHAGVLLYASGAAALLLMGIALRILRHSGGGAAAPEPTQTPPLLSDAMTGSVSSAVKSMVNICAWVLLFSAVGHLLRLIPVPETARLALTCILEISSGCAAAARQVPLWTLAAMLSFSGICVLCQLMPGCRRCGVSAGELLLSRGISSALSGGICALLCRLFPAYVQTSAGFQPLYHAGLSVSVPACAALLIMGLIVINEVDIRHKT